MKARAAGEAAIVVGYIGESGRHEVVLQVAEEDAITICELAMAIKMKLLADDELTGVRGMVEGAWARAKAKRGA